MYLSAEAVFILIKHNSHFMKRASKHLALVDGGGAVPRTLSHGRYTVFGGR